LPFGEPIAVAIARSPSLADDPNFQRRKVLQFVDWDNWIDHNGTRNSAANQLSVTDAKSPRQITPPTPTVPP
jgi:hypothetical protein